MQVLFFMGLIGVIFTTMTFINASVTVTAMQKKVEQLANVEKMFTDVEFALTKGVLLNQADLFLEESDGKLDTLEFMAGYVKWNNEELITDPWGKDYVVKAASARQTIYADNLGAPDSLGSPTTNAIDAYVTAFLLISAGPDGKFGQTEGALPEPWPATYNDIRAYTPANNGVGEVGADDIYTTFTTYAAAVSLWNRAKNVTDKVESLIVNNYTNQLELFQPEIIGYYQTLNSDEIFDASGNYILKDDKWLEDLDDPVAYPNFPRIQNNLNVLGATGEMKRMPEFLSNLSLVVAPGSHDASLTLSLTNPQQNINNNWRVTYTKAIEGSGISVTP